ncbi:MAG: hypothetical protein QI197_04500 [Candidatus Korarchaeota archaeon]|nr:hypothetical protein [Candidatus Korarchaeota archaeon]
MIPGFRITPWEVSGDTVDYNALISLFELDVVTTEVRNLFQEVFGEEHYLISRGIFYAHRFLRLALLDLKYDRAKVYIFTGRGASGPMHIGHLIPVNLAKWMQERLDLHFFFQISDDEKFVLRPDLGLKQVRKYALENALDFVALGFDEKRTHIIWDTQVASWLYPLSLKLAKRISLSELKNLVKIDDSWNVGVAFYSVVQSMPALMMEMELNEPYRALVPMAVDQDPLMRVSVLIADKMGLRKPGMVHSKFLLGLKGEPKMGTRYPESAIFLTDPPEVVREKIEGSVCGPPRRCPALSYLRAFDPDDESFFSIWEVCFNDPGEGCKLAKKRAIEVLIPFIEEHLTRRKEMRDKVDEYLMKEPPIPLDKSLDPRD